MVVFDEVVSTTGLIPETVTDSASAPTLSSTSTLATKPTVRRMSSRRTVWKPDSEYTTVNVPIGSGVSRYSPRSSVTTVISGTCSAGLVVVTVTPGRTAPLVSLTWPMMLAGAWAQAIPADIHSAHRLIAVRRNARRTIRRDTRTMAT